MACSITITSVTGIGPPGGIPSVIEVRGTATDCKEVTVTADCGGGSFSATVPVAADGSWAADLAVPSNAGCVCGKEIRIHVFCTADPGCFKDFSGAIECKPPEGCPSIGLLAAIGDCNPDGTRAVTLTATIASATPGAAQFAFGDGALGAAFAFPPASHTETHDYSPAGPYTATLSIILPTGCPSASIAVGPLAECACPEVIDLTASVAGCAGGGSAATVSFTGTVMGSPIGCTYHWDFGDGSPDVVTTVPSATHAYTTAGTFAVAVTLICGDCVRTTTVSVVVPPCCPLVTDITVYVDPANACADGAGRFARITFTATTNPAGAPGTFTWMFDDGSPPQTTAAPTIDHDYATPGTKTIQVSFTPSIPGCPATTHSETFSVASCGTTPPPPPPGGEGGGCTGLRWAAVILAILATLALYICICVPGAGMVFCWIAAGFAAVSAILLAIWYFFCPNKPCMWGLLLASQIALGAGLGALYFAPCCPWLWAVGAGLIIAGIAGMLTWRVKCKKTWCQLFAELAVVITVVIIPVIGWLGLIPALAACLNPWVVAAISTLSAAIALALAKCATDS